MYKLWIFFKDEEQPTENEFFETETEALKRKEEILANKDKWFIPEEIELIDIEVSE